MPLRRWLPIVACCAALLPAGNCDGGPSFEQDVPLDMAYFSRTVGGVETNSRNKKLTVGIGSGAWHTKGDEPGILYTITDRGPNIDIGDAPNPAFIGFNPVTAGTGKIFPIPHFSPSIYKLQVTPGAFHVLEILQIKDKQGVPLPGASIPAIEQAFNAAGAMIPGHPEAVDSEALVRLANGDFWVASEYGPDLLRLGPDGRILDRLVPKGLPDPSGPGGTLPPRIPGKENLPDYYNFRRLNRGFESIAVSPDEKFLYTIIQSPLEKRISSVNKGRQSRCLRLLKIDRATQLPVKEVLYVEQPFSEFTLDLGPTSQQGNVKLSELVCLGTDKLLVLERETKHTKLFVVKLTDATTNTLGMSVEAVEIATDPVATPGAPVSPVGVTTLAKSLVFDSATDYPGLVEKIEGIAWLGGGHFVLFNDNDFSTADVAPNTPAVTTVTRIFIAPSNLQ